MDHPVQTFVSAAFLWCTFKSAILSDLIHHTYTKRGSMTLCGDKEILTWAWPPRALNALFGSAWTNQHRLVMSLFRRQRAKSLQAGVYQSNAFDRSTADQFVTNVFSSFCRVSQSINTEEIFVVALVTQSSIESQKSFVRYTTQKSTVNRIMSTFNCSCC